MKKLILLELAFLFLATTFSSNPPPPGWYQQTLPVADQINDILLDSLNGWAVTYGRISPPDTGYIMKTSDGGDNWVIQLNYLNDFQSVQFADINNGYACGGFGIGALFKTTNGGTNWNNITFGSTNRFTDLAFINKDTGWVCSDDSFDGGVFKTTNGGQSWVQELNLGIGNPKKIFFVNNDTGWIANDNRRLYKSTNSGVSWSLQFSSVFGIDAIFFLNGQKGWMRGGATTGNTIGISYTSNGGMNWFDSQGNTVGGFDLHFVNDTIGYAGTYSYPHIMKSTDGGKNWGYQIGPTESDKLVSVINNDTSNAWAGQIMHTKDGGGKLITTGIDENNNITQKGFYISQNYPNPFNPKTVINYELQVTSFVKLKIFTVLGKEIKTPVNQRQNSGEYKIEFDGSNLSSGVYFYQLEIYDDKTNEVFSETKKMLLVK